MKVYTKIVMDWDGNEIDSEFYEYDGPVALCGGGSGGSQRQTTVQKSEPSTLVRPYLGKGYGAANFFFDEGVLGGAPVFPEQTYVSRNPLENQAQREMLRYSMGPMRGQIGDVAGAQRFMLNDAVNVANNPYVSGMVDAAQNRTLRNYTENLLPAIRRGSVAAGQLGGSRQALAEAAAMRTTSQDLADIERQIMGDAYGQGLKQQASAMQMAPHTMGLMRMPFDIMGEVGAYQRGEDELALQERMMRHQFPYERKIRNLDNYMAFLQGAPWNSQTSAKVGGQDRNRATGVLGGALMGGSLASAVPGLGGLGIPLAIGGGLIGGWG